MPIEIYFLFKKINNVQLLVKVGKKTLEIKIDLWSVKKIKKTKKLQSNDEYK